jgi:lipopolysaccharide heptosyltransferase I
VKALVVRLSAIGDVVHTLPALAALRRHGAEVHWLAEPAGAALLDGNPPLARLHRAPAARAFRLSGARAAARALRRERFDVAIDFQGLWKSAAWARLSGARRVLGYGPDWRREPASALLMRERARLPEGLAHVIDKNLALLRPLGIEAVGLREFPLPADPRAERAAQDGLSRLGLGRAALALLNPGGGWASKLWPPERHGELARGLRERGLVPLVTWGPGEDELAARVVAASDGAAVRAFPTSLLEYAALARRARLVVAADTGPLHLACAVGAPVVGLYGPTDPARNGPFSPQDEALRAVPPCAPCHRRRCAAHDGVMARIVVADVLAAAGRRLRSPAPAQVLAV